MSGERKDIARTQTIMHAGKISAPSPKYYAKGPVDVVAHECELSEVCILSMIISIFNGFIISSRQAGTWGYSRMKGAGMLVVTIRDANFLFWYHLGCSGQNDIIFSRLGLHAKKYKNVYVWIFENELNSCLKWAVFFSKGDDIKIKGNSVLRFFLHSFIFLSLPSFLYFSPFTWLEGGLKE